MLKHILKKARLFFLLIILSVGIFNACAVSKYDYYYSALESDGSNIKKDIYYFDIDSLTISDKKNNKIGNVFFSVRTASDIIELLIKNDLPVYIDYQQSIIKINDSVCKIKSYESDIAKRKLFEPHYFVKNHLDYLKLGYVPIRDILSLYKSFEDKKYELHAYKINEENKNYPTIKFSEENTPLKISLSIAYSADKEFQDKQTMNLNIHQTALIKLKNRRKDELQNNYPLFISFSVVNETGKVWGWPELRKGMGWTATVICLPVTLIVDLIPVVFMRKETGTVPFPLFE
ncbi:MAG: hypothetical protein LBT25_01795 [Candidatus Symbiothrix sp.]|nr:hypothetical protein [Candidatus Symbiothrix sp.]